ncbi:hypothetical protein RirG_263930 [Rhizophagus irregularis DAOM 197198w]|uniref:Uncharacterized protein n=1 Tax=Rhizophagus irregularis (strain DAOM 197198w) TaxID=1432141 RepID=A0A015IBJ8_RHIIW|nr:hypothetical protein RirG_263930 [Rhizophagus irregularis DAOM 197198w]
MELALAEIPGANRQTGKTSNGTLSTIRTQTTACKEGKYCSQDSGPEKLTKYTNQMHRDLQKDNILNDTQGSGAWHISLIHGSYTQFLNIFFTNKISSNKP